MSEELKNLIELNFLVLFAEVAFIGAAIIRNVVVAKSEILEAIKKLDGKA